MSQNNSSRTSLSLLLSTLLHGSVIAFIAIGPTYLKGVLDPQVGQETKVVDVSLTESPASTATLADLNPVREAKPVEIKKVTPTPITKSVAKPKPVTQKLPKKIVPVDFNEPTETTEVATAPTDDEVKIQAEPALPYEEDQLEEVESDKNEPAVAKEETTTESEPAAPIAPATTPVAEAASTESATSGSANASTSQGHGLVDTSIATQNYLELKQVVGNKPPAYTPEMRLKQLQGRGQLVYFVNKNGEISDLKLAQSTGSPVLDQTAISAFKKYKFVPGQEGYTLHDFEFVLKGPAESSRALLRTSVK